MSCNEWKESVLKDVIEFNPKETIKKGTLSKKVAMDKLDTFTRKISGYEETEFTSGTKFRNGDTLLARITPCLENGKTARVDILEDNEIGFGSTEFIVMREKEGKTINDFIYYLSISPEFRNIAIKSMTGSSGRQRVQKDVLENVEIKLPPLEEQEKIANILSCLDDKIELNNEMNKTLEEMAQSIFKRWFVDFEFPNEDGEPYKSSGGEMVDSELGMIPKGWEVVNYINTSDIQYGFAFKSKLFNDKEGKPIIRIRDISNSYTPTYTTEEYNDLYIVTKNDILVGMDGEFKAHIWGGKDSLLNQRVLRIRPKDNNSIAYSYFSIKEPLRYLENSKVGTTVIHLGKKDIDNIKIVYPPNNLISKYRDIADNLINKICENKVEIMELSELRDRLLPKLMIGEIKVN